MSDYKLVQYRGRWAVQFYEGKQRFRYSLGTTDRKAAERGLAVFKAERERPAQSDLASLWIACREEYSARRTGRELGYIWKAIGAQFGSLSPTDITHRMCTDYISARRSDGVSDTTIYNELSHLRLVLNWAKKHGYIDATPFIPRPPTPKPRERYLTRDEAKALLKACAPLHARTFINIALQTGARSAAICDLTWDRVSFDERRVDFRVPAQQRMKGRAVVPMTNTLREALLEAHAASTTQWVIEHRGKRVASVKKALGVAIDKAGLGGTGVSAHVFRHTAAVWMANSGVPIPVIANVLGHEDTRTTERVYAEHTPEYVQSVLEATSALEMK